MTKLKIQKKRNDVARLLRWQNRHKNVLKWSTSESDNHINAKFKICKYLKEQGEEFYTEAIFVGGKGRADIVASDRSLIIEIVDSESEASIIAKKHKYPLPVIFVNAQEQFNERLIQ